MKIRLPLYAKILCWFFANILLIAALIYVFFRFQFHMDMNSLIAGRAGDRIEALAEAIRGELNVHSHAGSHAGWDAILDRFGKAYGVHFALFWGDGGQAAGATLKVPESVALKLSNQRPGGPWGNMGQPPPFPADFRPPRPGFEPPWMERLHGHDARVESSRGPKLVMHTENPSRYWILIRFPVNEMDRPPRMLSLVAVSHSLNVGGLFFDFAMVIAAAGGALALSALFWMPLVRRLTHAISQMTRATAEIAEGRFDVRVGEKRRDELGSLGQGINQMATRLAGLVHGQKRFLGDVAHELCTPIARIQMALGILEQRAEERELPYLADLREEVQTIASLVNELLSFSKASLGGTKIKLTSVPLRPVVEKAIFHEGISEATIDLSVEESIWVLADSNLLLRSISNLVRNAIRYAGTVGPITITATRSVGKVTLVIADCGPGIPEAAQLQIFDPFYRADPSRDRETGGVGLGLSIVKTCIESCSGSVSCRNRAPTGLEVTVTLKLATPPE